MSLWMKCHGKNDPCFYFWSQGRLQRKGKFQLHKGRWQAFLKKRNNREIIPYKEKNVYKEIESREGSYCAKDGNSMTSEHNWDKVVLKFTNYFKMKTLEK